MLFCVTLHPGLQNIHLLTLKQKYELRVDLEDFENATAFASYTDFSLSPNAISAEEDGYTLHVSGFTDGGAGKMRVSKSHYFFFFIRVRWSSKHLL